MVKLNLTRIRILIIILLIGVTSFTFGYSFGFQGYKVEASGANVTINRELPVEHKDLDFSMFWKIWDTLDTSYFDHSKLDNRKMVLGAIKGMVAAVGDPYTVFLTESENKVTEEDLSGNFEGIGIQIGFKGSSLAVMAPLDGSPAEEAGIKAGDIIAGIKDEDKDIERGTVGITLPEAVQIIRGKAGTKVTLSLLREGSDRPIILDVTRREINVPSVVLTYVGPEEKVAHLKVSRFGRETMAEWTDAVNKISQKTDLKGVVVDLRNNPGGYLQGAVDLGSEFLKEGDVVVAEQYADGSKDEYKVERAGKLTHGRVVVLVNGGSASASEILAGALRDARKTPIVGEKSFGKGTVQEAKSLESGVGIHVTVAKWLTPSGFWVNEKGLSPDYEVKDNPDTTEDEQLVKAVDVLSGLSLSSGL